MRKQKNVIIAIIVIIVIGIGGYVFNKYKANSKDSINTIIVTKGSWGDTGEPIEYKIHKGDVITIDTSKYSTWNEEEQKYVDEQEELTIEIVKIEKDSITIKTNQELCDTNSVIDTKNIFNIEKNKKLELNTPTLDAQDVYEIEIK